MVSYISINFLFHYPRADFILVIDTMSKALLSNPILKLLKLTHLLFKVCISVSKIEHVLVGNL